MKALKIIIHIAIVVVFCFSGIAIADKWKDESGKRGPQKHPYGHGDGDFKKRPHDRDHREHKKRPDYHKHHGYRERPYARGRHHRHYVHKGHQYDYHGHWISWEEWDRYIKKHADLHKHGHYYRDNTHLMFRFCDPVTANCLFFSIGR